MPFQTRTHHAAPPVVGALHHAAAASVLPPPAFAPAPLKKADDTGVQATLFRRWLVNRLQRGAQLWFCCLLALACLVLFTLYLPEIVAQVAGLHKVVFTTESEDGTAFIMVRTAVLNTLEADCRQGVRAALLEGEVTAAAALDPLRRCREFAEFAVTEEYLADGDQTQTGGRGVQTTPVRARHVGTPGTHHARFVSKPLLVRRPSHTRPSHTCPSHTRPSHACPSHTYPPQLQHDTTTMTKKCCAPHGALDSGRRALNHSPLDTWQ